MLMANSAAILTDAFPARQRGLALGINQIAAIAGQFIGLLAGGLLAAAGLARGVLGQRARRRLRHGLGLPQAASTPASGTPAAIDWWGNVTFAVGLSALLIGVTSGLQPLRHAHDGLDESRR